MKDSGEFVLNVPESVSSEIYEPSKGGGDSRMCPVVDALKTCPVIC